MKTETQNILLGVGLGAAFLYAIYDHRRIHSNQGQPGSQAWAGNEPRGSEGSGGSSGQSPAWYHGEPAPRTGGLLAASEDRGEDYGAVHRRMGGRGPGAGRGTASWMGGRDPDHSYDFSAPSSLRTGKL